MVMIWRHDGAFGSREARIELARRYLHVFGPGTYEAFAAWAGIPPRAAAAAFDDCRASLTRRPARRSAMRGFSRRRTARPPCRRREGAGGGEAAAERRCVFPVSTSGRTDAARRERGAPCARLWTSRVWPGALLVDGVIAGTWRRADAAVSIETWRRLSPPNVMPSKPRSLRSHFREELHYVAEIVDHRVSGSGRGPGALSDGATATAAPAALASPGGSAGAADSAGLAAPAGSAAADAQPRLAAGFARGVEFRTHVGDEQHLLRSASEE